ncbi:MAG: trypsin-like peptidase domain-containing protein [Phormidesmis sp.]
MTSSSSSEPYEPQHEFDTPFLSETVFEAATKADRVPDQTDSETASPFLNAFEPTQKTLIEPTVSEEASGAEFEEALKTAGQDVFMRTASNEATEPKSLETLAEGEIDESVWRMRPPVRYQADRYICWAEAISSWSMVTKGVRKFKTGQDAIDFFKPYGVVAANDSLKLPEGMEKAKSVFDLDFKKLEQGDHLSAINWVPMLRRSHLIVIFKRPDAVYFHFVVVFGVDRFHICFMDPELNPALPTLDKVKRNRVCSRLENFGAGADEFYVFWKARSASKEIEDHLVQPELANQEANGDLDDLLASASLESEYEDYEYGYESSEEFDERESALDTEPTEGEFLNELEYQNFVRESDDPGQRDEAIDEAIEEEEESSRRASSRKRKSSYVSKINTRISDSPAPGSFYRIKRGDNLLTIAGRAYAVQPGGKRLAFAQFINRNSLNKRYWVQGKEKFVKTYFPNGIIAFYPKFSCDLKSMLEPKQALTGKCYAVIWIPPLRSYRNPSFKDEALFEAETVIETTLVDQQEVRSPEDILFSEVPDPLHLKAPFRWICLIGSYFPDPDLSGNLISGFGTGILISPRHVLTAAHVLYTDYLGSGKKPTPARNIADKVVVAVGFHGKSRENRKFLGKYDSKIQKAMKILVPDEWKASEDNRDYDFAVIDLGEDIDEVSKGYWGGDQNYAIIAINPVTRNKRDLVSVGYPEIKIKQDIYSQWKSLGETDHLRTERYQRRFKNLLVHDALVYPGMSGGPMWTEIKAGRSFVRHLVAINSFSQEETVEVDLREYLKDPGSAALTVTFTKEHDVGVAMTRRVLDRLNTWGIQV